MRIWVCKVVLPYLRTRWYTIVIVVGGVFGVEGSVSGGHVGRGFPPWGQ